MHKTIGMELKVLFKILNTNSYNIKNKMNVKMNLHIYFFICCRIKAYSMSIYDWFFFYTKVFTGLHGSMYSSTCILI